MMYRCDPTRRRFFLGYYLLLSFVSLHHRVFVVVVAAQAFTYPRAITIVNDDFPATYVGQVASFGDQMLGGARANLMLPPAAAAAADESENDHHDEDHDHDEDDDDDEDHDDDDNAYLCHFPESLVNFTSSPSAGGSSSFSEKIVKLPDIRLPIALFVSVGGCTAEQKARIVLLIQERVTPAVRFLFIYGDDERNDGLMRLHPDTRPVQRTMNRVGIVYVPYTYGVSIKMLLRDRAASTGANPHFLSAGKNRSASWILETRVEGEYRNGDYQPHGESPSPSNRGKDNFYWFRFVLFTLLIVSPCCRACYLWYAGGGRFHFRRNDRGRIVGVQYIPPMPYWLSNGRPQYNDPISTTLSEEEFNALPEIVYEPLPGSAGAEAEQPAPAVPVQVQVAEAAAAASAAAVVEIDLNHPAAAAQIIGETTTTATTEDNTLAPVSLIAAAAAAAEEEQVGGGTSQQAKEGTAVLLPDSDDDENNNNSNIDKATTKLDVEQPLEVPLQSGGASHGEETGGGGGRTTIPPPPIPPPPPVLGSPRETATATTAANSCNSNSNPLAGTTTAAGPAAAATAAAAAAAAALTTTCTMCSICIDDFEIGEKLTLLPRCQHAFHRDCIKPWVMERQGCCPLCKTEVLEPPPVPATEEEGGGGGGGESSTSSERGGGGSQDHHQRTTNDSNDDDHVVVTAVEPVSTVPATTPPNQQQLTPSVPR